MSEVYLAIYDLSRGMARSLSAQFLGPDFAIEAIPHTGVVVFGKEYFFGAGIQSEDPQEFRRSTGMYPIQLESLGRTPVTREAFERWCVSVVQDGTYSANSYDLLSRNCNNFSHDAALRGLKLSRGVPEWVLDVPRRFLSSPMGQVVRPMLQQMQVTNVDGSMPVAQFDGTEDDAVSLSATNPWAAFPSSSKHSAESIATPTLDSLQNPLLSSDLRTVPTCVKKITSIADEEQLQALLEIERLLTNRKTPDRATADKVCQAILQCLKISSHATYALMLLRILVIQNPTSTKECLAWLVTRLSTSNVDHYTERTLVWLTVANDLGTENPHTLPSLESIVELAINDLSFEKQGHVEVRQAASAVLYNATLNYASDQTSNDLSDIYVSILFASLENYMEEPDVTCQLRRLMAVGRILKPDKTCIPAKLLMNDLGFPLLLEQVKNRSLQTSDSRKCQTIAAELLSLLKA